jgi:L-alanine-DL-glutamate epimerase-like enolase superfamily enzyme
MSTYDRIRDLPLRVEGYDLEVRALELGEDFRRLTTVIRLHGAGEEGVGEDVCYDPGEHESQAAAGPVLPLAGTWTIDSLSRHLDGLDLFHAGPPVYPMSGDYRRWAYESAALDLALRQAGVSLAEALGRTPSPVRFVVSTRLDEPPTSRKVTTWLAHDPTLRFKLDPTDDWSDELMAELAGLGVVETLDMKGQYETVPFGVPSDPATYRRILAAFPDAMIEDPRLTPDLRATLAGHEDRVTWDAPLHSVDDILALEWTPRTVNMKPSRFGPLSRLFAAYDHLEREGIAAYSGGQTELGPGRGQVQYLASLFHPDAPNDIAPGGYNDPNPPDGLPGPPLPVAASPTGFRWG